MAIPFVLFALNGCETGTSEITDAQDSYVAVDNADDTDDATDEPDVPPDPPIQQSTAFRVKGSVGQIYV